MVVTHVLLLPIYSSGFEEIKRVDILWSDRPKGIRGSSGELYLKVSMLRDTGKRRAWSTLLNHCLHIMNLIDWSRSHPDNTNDFCVAYGIDAGWKYFLNVSSLNFISFSFIFIFSNLLGVCGLVLKCKISHDQHNGVEG